ncbi:hypothetical protein B0H11DRAFT_1911817 [Mycena galericulata]|nr:hypothetical protein B0H11DRAFT_1911817 [Mycena galericulata]
MSAHALATTWSGVNGNSPEPSGNETEALHKGYSLDGQPQVTVTVILIVILIVTQIVIGTVISPTELVRNAQAKWASMTVGVSVRVPDSFAGLTVSMTVRMTVTVTAHDKREDDINLSADKTDLRFAPVFRSVRGTKPQFFLPYMTWDWASSRRVLNL